MIVAVSSVNSVGWRRPFIVCAKTEALASCCGPICVEQMVYLNICNANSYRYGRFQNGSLHGIPHTRQCACAPLCSFQNGSPNGEGQMAEHQCATSYSVMSTAPFWSHAPLRDDRIMTSLHLLCPFAIYHLANPFEVSCTSHIMLAWFHHS